jgi:hypothetical protein
MEPICHYCNASDKFRCKTKEQAHNCSQYIELQRIQELVLIQKIEDNEK